jgi:electron transport complex protein RnfB
MSDENYRLLAERLDALPNGFPATPDGAELRLLRKLFTPEEAALAASLRMTLETPAEIAARTGGDKAELAVRLKGMARRGLVKAGRGAGGLGYGLLPFVVGIYEAQGNTIDAEMARLFEDYYRQAFGRAITIQPHVHRVIPVQKTVCFDMEVRHYESAAEIVESCRSWGVVDCICRKQKALIGEPCGHPMDNCMVFSPSAGAFEGSASVRALTQEEALATLQRAADAGLVHSVSNSQEGIWYICNCCTCGCGVLRGLADLGMANVIARSAFVNRVDEELCSACGFCMERCQFDALALGMTVQVERARCAGCGLCVTACPEGALALVRRPDDEVLPPPVTGDDWMAARAAARGLDLGKVL